MPEGKLFYVIGPSGSGKDSLMNFAREQINGSLSVLFAHRYITRPPDAGGENHVCLSHAEFAKRKEMGFFALDWESHQNCYGIGTEIINWMQNGANVVVNGSREYLQVASQRFPKIQVILIEVSPEVLRKRLTDRGRETAEEINARIERSSQIMPVTHPNLILLNNDAPLAETGAIFIEILKNTF